MLKVICIADNLINEPATIPTPNTTALAQYGIIPMSLYTGKGNVTIPLFNSTLRGINLDMILNSIQKRNDALLQGVKLKLHCQIENLYATTIKELLTELLVQPQQNLIIKE